MDKIITAGTENENAGAAVILLRRLNVNEVYASKNKDI